MVPPRSNRTAEKRCNRQTTTNRAYQIRGRMSIRQPSKWIGHESERDRRNVRKTFANRTQTACRVRETHRSRPQHGSWCVSRTLRCCRDVGGTKNLLGSSRSGRASWTCPTPKRETTPAKLGLPRNHTPEEYFAKVIEQHQQQHGCGSVPGGLARAAGELLHPEVDPARELLAKVSYAVGCFGFGCGRLRCPSPSPSESEHADGTDAEEGQGRGFRNGLNVDVNGVAGDVGVTSQLQDAWARRRARQGTGGVYDVAPGGGHRLLYPGVIDRAQSGPSHHCFASIGRPSARLLRRRWVAGSMEKLMTWTEPSQKAI